MSSVMLNIPQLSNIRILVLNQAGVIWTQVKIECLDVFNIFQTQEHHLKHDSFRFPDGSS